MTTNFVSIIRPKQEHAPELFNLITDNSQYLSKFLSWPKYVVSVIDIECFITQANLQYESGQSDIFLIFHNSVLSGVVSFNEFDRENNIGTIGYWIGEKFQGQGIATRAVKELITLGFADYDLNKVVIRTAVDNTPSALLAERLGFKKEGIARENELLNGIYVDHFIFSKLKSDT